MKAYFISDLHIKNEAKNKGQILLNFLANLPEDTTHLVLLGDVFDLWVADHEYFKKKYPKIIQHLLELKNKGIEVHYFEGNHDIHLKKFWEKELGFRVHESSYFFKIGSKVVRAEHGDLMNPEDKGYLLLRWFWRTPVLDMIAHNIPGKIVNWIGERSSKVSRVYTDKVGQKYKDTVRNITRTYAQKVYDSEPFDYFICGHTHVKDDFTFSKNNKEVRSINLGTWLEKPVAFLITEDLAEFIEV